MVNFFNSETHVDPTFSATKKTGKHQKPIHILFDASILANGAEQSGMRSGIFFTALNILLEMLKREDLNVSLYCDPKSYHSVDRVFRGHEQLKRRSFVEYSLVDRLRARMEGLKQERKKNKGKTLPLQAIRTLQDVLNTMASTRNALNLNYYYRALFQGVDVFFSPWGHVPPEIRSLGHIQKFLMVYDMIPLVFPEFFPEMANEKSGLYKYFHSFDLAPRYFAISEFTKRDFIRFTGILPEKVKSIMLSTAMDFNRPSDCQAQAQVREKYNIPREKKYIFSLCTLEPRKNLIFALKNFAAVIKRNGIDDLIFVLGGGFWKNYIQELDCLIGNMDGCRDKILKIGYVDDEDVPALYQGAFMFIYPSLYEGFGMPILEAMRSGCPVICSNSTSMPEVIGDSGPTVNPLKDEELVLAIEKLYYDENFRMNCIQKGLERSRLFSWGKTVDQIIQCFRFPEAPDKWEGKPFGAKIIKKDLKD